MAHFIDHEQRAKLQALRDAPVSPGRSPVGISRKRKYGKAVRRGYAATPGSGPQGETCRGCEHYAVRLERYRKCRLMRDEWTGGAATDIKASSPACAKWEAKTP